MPYRIDLTDPPARASETLIDLGAIDIELLAGGIAALMPDSLSVETVEAALGEGTVHVSNAAGRDDDSVWVLRPRPVNVGGLEIVPSGGTAGPSRIVLGDSAAFGTGLHPTTALCLHAIEALAHGVVPSGVVDVGTGSGILALAALRHGVEHAIALDVDPGALRAAVANAHLNVLAHRLWPVCGGPDALRGSWPLVVANIRAAELMTMAPALVRRIASRGHLVLSGIPHAVAPDVARVYIRLGLMQTDTAERDGWTMLGLRPSW